MSDGSTGAPSRANRERQAAVVFNDIAQLASCVERLGVLLVDSGDDDDRDTAAYQTAIKALSAQIGLVADIGSRLCGGWTWHNADPCEWLLPPVFREHGNDQPGRTS